MALIAADACAHECAIYHEGAVPDPWKDYIALNAELAPQCPSIVTRRQPLADCQSAAG